MAFAISWMLRVDLPVWVCPTTRDNCPRGIPPWSVASIDLIPVGILSISLGLIALSRTPRYTPASSLACAAKKACNFKLFLAIFILPFYYCLITFSIAARIAALYLPLTFSH